MWKAVSDGAKAASNFMVAVLILIFTVLIYFAVT